MSAGCPIEWPHQPHDACKGVPFTDKARFMLATPVPATPKADPREEEVAALRARVATLTEALDIITRACVAGAYVGRTSPAVTQAQAALTGATPTPAADAREEPLLEVHWRQSDSRTRCGASIFHPAVCTDDPHRVTCLRCLRSALRPEAPAADAR